MIIHKRHLDHLAAPTFERQLKIQLSLAVNEILIARSPIDGTARDTGTFCHRRWFSAPHS